MSLDIIIRTIYKVKTIFLDIRLSKQDLLMILAVSSVKSLIFSDK